MNAKDDLFGHDDRIGREATTGYEAVTLAHATDLAGFRQHARRLLAQQAKPAEVSWHCADTVTADLFASQPPSQFQDNSGASNNVASSSVRVPPDFLLLCQNVILHSDPQRFGLLYRLLWRNAHEPGLRHDPLDADRVKASQMAQAVRRDMHKMKAFVRFRTLQDDTFQSRPVDGPLHVAWFEPEHHIVEAIAPFFTRRFTQMRWAILTPERCVAWDGATIRFTPGAMKQDVPPADAGEALWLTYYQNIFNPARLKLKMMQKEMPRRYWANLPEAQFISELTAAASERRTTMIDAPAQIPRRRIPVAPIADPATSRDRFEPQLEHPSTLALLREAIGRCSNCSIAQQATQAVSGEGPALAQLMVVGEQPGDQEDLQGRPFVGPAGKLFDRALADLGHARSSLFITNAVKHFKYEVRGKRRIHKTPSQQEATACQHWLEREIELVKPGGILALGATAAAALLGRRVAVMSERGQWFVRPDGLRVLVTLHPAALLRMDADIRDAAYSDWLVDLKMALESGTSTSILENAGANYRTPFYEAPQNI